MSHQRVLEVKRMLPSALMPMRAYPGDAGLDIHAAEETVIDAGAVQVVRTGLAVRLPKGTEGQIRPRSGLARVHQVTVLNSPGTIDEGYTGELLIILINHGQVPFRVTEGMKIAQLVIHDRVDVTVVERDSLPEGARGSSRFGSSGN